MILLVVLGFFLLLLVLSLLGLTADSRDHDYSMGRVMDWDPSEHR